MVAGLANGTRGKQAAGVTEVSDETGKAGARKENRATGATETVGATESVRSSGSTLGSTGIIRLIKSLGNRRTSQAYGGASTGIVALLAAGPFAIAVLYAAHLPYQYLSYQATSIAVLCWLFYGCFGNALRVVGRREDGLAFLERGWLILTGGIAVTALAAVYGLLPVPGAILRTEDRELAAAGARLGGLFQYPNTFGAVMAAALLERLTALARLPAAAFTRTARWRGYRTGALAPVFALCLLLSESRGAIVAAAAGWAAGCLLLRGRERLRYALHTGVATAAGAPLAGQLATAELAPPVLPGLLSLAAVLAAALALSGLVARAASLERVRPGRAADAQRCAETLPGRGLRTWRRARRLPAAALLCVAGLATLAAAGGLAALSGLAGRLTRAATLYARGELYADALRLLRESPWFGQGGDVWRTMYRSIQSRPYVGSEVHGGYLDIALDLGLSGLAVMLCWLGVAAFALFRHNRRLLPAFAVLLLHSAMDFNMSFGLFWLLIIWLVVWGSCGPSRKFLALPGLVRAFSGQRWGRRISAGFLATMLLAGGVNGLFQAESQRLQYLAAVASASRPAGVARLLERSIALAPWRTEPRLAWAAVSAPAAAGEVLRRGMAYERSHPALEQALGTALAQQGNLAALIHLCRAAELDRYSRAAQTAALRGISLLANRLNADGRPGQAKLVASAGLEIYRSYVSLAERTEEVRNDREFRLTREAVQLASRLETIGKIPTAPASAAPAESLATPAK
ncbi:O-antigen ligase family protein [Fontibacillus phaseoli]|nr:O-antigen ligase family protein [Fontibacillus phaseoli]